MATEDFVGSILKGGAAGLSTFGQAKDREGQQKLKKAQEAEAERKALEKEWRKLYDERSFWQQRADDGDDTAEFVISKWDSLNEPRMKAGQPPFIPGNQHLQAWQQDFADQEAGDDDLAKQLSELMGPDPGGEQSIVDYTPFYHNEGFTSQTPDAQVAAGLKDYRDVIPRDSAGVASPELMNILSGTEGSQAGGVDVLSRLVQAKRFDRKVGTEVNKRAVGYAADDVLPERPKPKQPAGPPKTSAIIEKGTVAYNNTVSDAKESVKGIRDRQEEWKKAHWSAKANGINPDYSDEAKAAAEAERVAINNELTEAEAHLKYLKKNRTSLVHQYGNELFNYNSNAQVAPSGGTGKKRSGLDRLKELEAEGR